MGPKTIFHRRVGGAESENKLATRKASVATVLNGLNVDDYQRAGPCITWRPKSQAPLSPH